MAAFELVSLTVSPAVEAIKVVVVAYLKGKEEAQKLLERLRAVTPLLASACNLSIRCPHLRESMNVTLQKLGDTLVASRGAVFEHIAAPWLKRVVLSIPLRRELESLNSRLEAHERELQRAVTIDIHHHVGGRAQGEEGIAPAVRQRVEEQLRQLQVMPEYSGEEEVIQDLVRQAVKLVVSTGKRQEAALQKVAVLGSKVGDADEVIAAAGCIQPLVQLLGSSDSSAKVKEQAAAALRKQAAKSASGRTAVAEAGAVPVLVGLLNSGGAGREKMQAEAAHALAELALDSPPNQEAILAAGGIPSLVSMLGSGSAAGALQKAVAALRNLAAGNPTVQTAIARAKGIPPLLDLLRSGSAEAQEHAAAALHSLAAGSRTYNREIVAQGGIPALLRLLGPALSGLPKLQQQAVWTLESMAADSNNREEVVAAGVILELLRLLQRPVAPKLAATSALASLAAIRAHHQPIKEAGGIRELVRVLDISSMDAGVHMQAARALGNLASGGLTVQEAAAAAKGIAPLVRLLRGGSSASQGVQEQAAWALRHLASELSIRATFRDTKVRGIQALEELVCSDSSSAAARVHAAAALGRLGVQRRPSWRVPRPDTQAVPPATPAAGAAAAQQTQSDEELARRLQEQYDAEADASPSAPMWQGREPSRDSRRNGYYSWAA